MTVYIVRHNEKYFNSLSGYESIFVGKNSKILASEYSGISDDYGCNIAFKNPNYCELTAQYWIWKNSKSNIKGIVHYRRFLKGADKNILSETEIETTFSNFEGVIVSKPVFVKKSVRDDYAAAHYVKDFDLARQFISESQPKYLEAFDRVASSKKYHSLNMLIAHSNLFDEYSAWIFSVLEYVESKSEYKDYDVYQSRIFGFLSERLLDVWIISNNIPVLEMPVLFLENNRVANFRRFLRQTLIRMVG